MNKLQTISTVLFAMMLTLLPVCAVATVLYHGLETTGAVLAAI